METLLTLKHLHKLQQQPKAVKESVGGVSSYRTAIALMKTERFAVEQPSGKVIEIMSEDELLNKINTSLTNEERKEVIELL